VPTCSILPSKAGERGPASPCRPGPSSWPGAAFRDLYRCPAMLVNHRFDILGWNPERAALMVDFVSLAVEQRNRCSVHLYPPLCDFKLTSDP